MKKKTLYAILLGVTMSSVSCSDFLDMSPTNAVSDKLVWASVENAELAVNDFYRYIDYLSVFNSGQCLAGSTDALTDQLKYGSYNYNSYCRIPSEIAYGGAVLTPGYVDTYLGNWSTMYDYVRRVNEGLSNLYKYGESISQEDKQRLEAEMKFFRGFLYTDLIKRYKDVILYDEDMTAITRDKDVTPEAQCWDFVYNDLSSAAKVLAVSTDPDGRITSGAAYALLSRAMLYAKRWDDAKAAAEKVLGIIDASVFVARRIVEVQSRYLKHCSRTFAVRCRDQRCMQVNESFVIEKFMYGESHCVPDPQYGSERICPRPEVCNAPEELQCMSFLLERICIRIGRTVYCDVFCLYFNCLSASDRLYKVSCHAKACSCRDSFHHLIVERGHVADNLYVIDGRTVVEGYESYILVSAFCPYPPFGRYFDSRLHFKQILDFAPCNHFFHLFNSLVSVSPLKPLSSMESKRLTNINLQN